MDGTILQKIRVRVIVGGMFVALLAVVGVFYGRQMIIGRAIDRTTYQIVTLEDGRNFFGKIESLSSEYVLLEDVFILQANEESLENELPFSLQRIGSQLYGPEEDLHVRKEHIISWQNLQKNSAVVTAINEYQQKNTSSEEDESEN